MIRACLASSADPMRCDSMRNPTVSMPISRAAAKCCSDTSASVQWVAMRATDAPASRARRRSPMVPTPGSSSTAILARRASSAAAATSLTSSTAEIP